MDPQVFARTAADAGVDGVLILDYPVEEAEPLRTPLLDAGLDPIFLISPTTSEERIRKSAELGAGFLYVISRLGVTGVRDRLPEDVGELMERVRALRGSAGGARLRDRAPVAGRRSLPRGRCRRRRKRAGQRRGRARRAPQR